MTHTYKSNFTYPERPSEKSLLGPRKLRRRPNFKMKVANRADISVWGANEDKNTEHL